MLINERDQGDRGLADSGGQFGQIIEQFLGDRVQDFILPKHFQPLGFVGGSGSAHYFITMPAECGRRWTLSTKSLLFQACPSLTGRASKDCGADASRLRYRDALMPEAPQIKINPPRRLTGGALAILSAYGLALMVPVLVAILFVSTLRLGALSASETFT